MSVKTNPSKFIDFQVLKQNVKIEDAVTFLGLKVNQHGDQVRGACPACKSGGDRALVITASKSVFYCFAAGDGGDVIALTAHIKSIGMKEAAEFLAASLTKSGELVPTNSQATVPYTVPEKKKAGFNPLTYLVADHPSVRALGISPETALHFGAGYAPKGIMRGRLAIPIHDAEGVLVAYCGRTISDESPAYIFPSGFQPQEYIFNAHQLNSGLLTLVREPLKVIKAHEGGVENVVAVFSETVTSSQLDLLSRLMAEKGCEALEYL